MERRFLEYLSPERVGSGQSVGDAENLVESQQRAETPGAATVRFGLSVSPNPPKGVVEMAEQGIRDLEERLFW